MQKVKNGYYVATSILYFINGALSILGGLLFAGLGLIVKNNTASFIESYLEDGYVLEEAQAMASVTPTVFIIMGVIVALSSIYMFIAGAKYHKYSYLTNEEATKYFNKCVAWCVVSFVFGSMLLGVLSCIGLCTIQQKQKNGEIGVDANYENTQTQPAQQNAQNDQTITVQSLDVLKERLERLEALKNANAITEEEYTSLRNQIMDAGAPKSTPNEEIAKNERLERLQALKDTGALSQEEFDILKNQIDQK